MNNAMQSYKQTQVVTLGRADVTLMLYNGAIRFLEQAIEKMIEKDMQAKGNLISKTIAIIDELNSSLNMTLGGELSQSLHKLYGFLTRNLTMANCRVDVEKAQSVLKNLVILRDSFQEAMNTPEAKVMLRQMGPVKQATSGSVEQSRIGGSIADRAQIIKETKEKAQALEKAQAKLAVAKTEEEKAIATEEVQKAREALLGKRNAMAGQENTPVSASLTNQASKAFATASGHVKGGAHKTVIQSTAFATATAANPASSKTMSNNLLANSQMLANRMLTGQLSTAQAFGQVTSEKAQATPVSAEKVNATSASTQNPALSLNGQSQKLQASTSFTSPLASPLTTGLTTGLANVSLQANMQENPSANIQLQAQKSAQSSAMYAKAHQQGLGKGALKAPVNNTPLKPSAPVTPSGSTVQNPTNINAMQTALGANALKGMPVNTVKSTTPSISATREASTAHSALGQNVINTPLSTLSPTVMQVVSPLAGQAPVMSAGLAEKKRNLYKNMTNA